VILFIGALVAGAVYLNISILAVLATLTGVLFLSLVRMQTDLTVDEREQTVGEKAARLAYGIFTPTLGIGALILLVPYQKLSSVFAKGEFAYLESLGMVFAYLTLFLIVLYAISYHFLNRKYGGGGNEE